MEVRSTSTLSVTVPTGAGTYARIEFVCPEESESQGFQIEIDALPSGPGRRRGSFDIHQVSLVPRCPSELSSVLPLSHNDDPLVGHHHHDHRQTPSSFTQETCMVPPSGARGLVTFVSQEDQWSSQGDHERSTSLPSNTHHPFGADLPAQPMRKHTSEQFRSFLNKNMAHSLRQLRKPESQMFALDEGMETEASDVSISDINASECSEGGKDVAPVIAEAMRLMTKANLVGQGQGHGDEQSSHNTPRGSPNHQSSSRSRSERNQRVHEFLSSNLKQSRRVLRKQESDWKQSLRSVDPSSKEKSNASLSLSMSAIQRSSSYIYEDEDDEFNSEGGIDVPQSIIEDIKRATSSFAYSSRYQIDQDEDIDNSIDMILKDVDCVVEQGSQGIGPPGLPFPKSQFEEKTSTPSQSRSGVDLGGGLEVTESGNLRSNLVACGDSTSLPASFPSDPVASLCSSSDEIMHSVSEIGLVQQSSSGPLYSGVARSTPHPIIFSEERETPPRTSIKNMNKGPDTTTTTTPGEKGGKKSSAEMLVDENAVPIFPDRLASTKSSVGNNLNASRSYDGVEDFLPSCSVSLSGDFA